MRLDWDRPGVLRATLKVEELAALVAGARMAAAALAGQSAEQAGELERAVTHISPASAPGATVAGYPRRV